MGHFSAISVYFSHLFVFYFLFFPSSLYCFFHFFQYQGNPSHSCFLPCTVPHLPLMLFSWSTFSGGPLTCCYTAPVDWIITLCWRTLSSACWKGSLHRAARCLDINCWLHSWMWTFERSQHKSPETISCPYRQPYSSHSVIVKGLGLRIWIHFVSCFPLMNHTSWALAEPRKEKSAEVGNFLDDGNALQLTCQTPVLKK